MNAEKDTIKTEEGMATTTHKGHKAEESYGGHRRHGSEKIKAGAADYAERRRSEKKRSGF
jgi:hypothetical protein